MCRQASCLLCGSNILSLTDSSKPYSKRIMTGTFSFIHTLSVQGNVSDSAPIVLSLRVQLHSLQGAAVAYVTFFPGVSLGALGSFVLFLRRYQNRENLAREMYSPIRRHITNISLEQQLFTHCMKTSVNAFYVRNFITIFLFRTFPAPGLGCST